MVDDSANKSGSSSSPMSEARTVSEQEEALRIADSLIAEERGAGAILADLRVLARAYLASVEREQVLLEKYEQVRYIAWEASITMPSHERARFRTALARADQEAKG